MDKLCQVFDKVLTLDLKDEYEMASNALESLLYNLCHMRPLQNYYTGKLVGYLYKAYVFFHRDVFFEISLFMLNLYFPALH